MSSIETKWNVEIEDRLDQLNKMEMGTEEFKTSVDAVTKLYDRTIEMEKLDIERKEKEQNRKIETELKLKQMKQERIDGWIRNGISVLGIGVTAGLTIWGTFKSLKFEETGTITTTAGRSFFSRLFQKQK